MRGRRGFSIGGLALVVALCALAPSAGASIKIQQSETLELLGEFDKASCKSPAGKKFGFTAFSLPAEDLYTLDVFIAKSAWSGLGDSYDLFYGGQDVTAYVFGPNPGESYGNDVSIPGTPDNTVWAGGVKVSANGKRYSVGAYGLADPTFSGPGMTVSGSAKCRYKRRR